jgi:16S rRNA U516 pseudouridylate synthase RsuA-like enzyme
MASNIRFGGAFALGLESVEQVDNIDHFPKPIGNASRHSRRNFQRLVQPDKVVVHRVQRHRAGMVLDLFAESVCQPSEAAHVHPHREVLALNK